MPYKTSISNKYSEDTGTIQVFDVISELCRNFTFIMHAQWLNVSTVTDSVSPLSYHVTTVTYQVSPLSYHVITDPMSPLSLTQCHHRQTMSPLSLIKCHHCQTMSPLSLIKCHHCHTMSPLSYHVTTDPVSPMSYHVTREMAIALMSPGRVITLPDWGCK